VLGLLYLVAVLQRLPVVVVLIDLVNAPTTRLIASKTPSASRSRSLATSDSNACSASSIAAPKTQRRVPTGRPRSGPVSQHRARVGRMRGLRRSPRTGTHRTRRRAARQAVAVVRDQPVDTLGQPPDGKREEQSADDAPSSARAQQGLGKGSGAPVHRARRSDPQHLPLCPLLRDAECGEVGELPCNEGALGLDISLDELHRPGTEAAVAVIEEQREVLESALGAVGEVHRMFTTLRGIARPCTVRVARGADAPTLRSGHRPRRGGLWVERPSR
jgi:hypothetical protein